MRGGISSLDYGWGVLSECKSSGDVGGSLMRLEKSETTSPRFSFQTSHSTRSVESGIMGMHLQKQRSTDSLRDAFEKSVGASRAGKSFKLAKWVPEVISPRLISTKDESEQLVCMQRQLEYVRGEISAHEELKENLDNRFSQHPQFQLVLANWNSKYDALNHEFLKYEAYIESLQSASVSALGVSEYASVLLSDEESGSAIQPNN